MDAITSATIVEQCRELWAQASAVWVAGGLWMAAIAADALLLFAIGLHAHLALQAKGFLSVPERVWRRWIDEPAGREGPIGDLLDAVTASGTIEGTARAFEDLAKSERAPFVRDLRVMRICVAAAPLLGLLGTVTGMLATFDALASGAGGEKTMGLIAEGISEALITTETGLVVALPGLFFQYQIARKHERYQAFLAHVETLTTQGLYRRLRGREAA